MGAWWRVALITSLVGLWFSLSYLKRYNYKWGFNYIGNHLYINLLLKVQKWFQNATIIALLIPVFLKDLLYNQYCLVAYIGKSSVRCPLKPSDSIPLCPNNPAH